MIDINDIAALLHVEEKLRAHGTAYPNMLAAVKAKLSSHEAEHAPKPEPKPEADPTIDTNEPAASIGNGERRI